MFMILAWILHTLAFVLGLIVLHTHRKLFQKNNEFFIAYVTVFLSSLTNFTFGLQFASGVLLEKADTMWYYCLIGAVAVLMHLTIGVLLQNGTRSR